MPMVKGKGATAGPDSTATDRTAQPRLGQEPPWGRVTPENRKMSFARHQNFDILTVAENASVATAAAAMVTAWEAWQADPVHEHHRILEASFEHYVTAAADHGFLLYVTYSK